MTGLNRISDQLSHRPFAEKVLELASEVTKELYPPGTRLRLDAEPVRELTEAEYYVTGCGYSLSHLLSLVVQLEQAPAYLAYRNRSKQLSAAGVTRVSDLIYHWENYLIRARALEDRVLQLVCDVLHLGINSKDVNFSSMRRNAHVESTSIGPVLDQVHALVAPVAGERNRVIHERGLLDEDFRRLEFWLLVSRMVPEMRGVSRGQYLTRIRNVVPAKAAEVETFLQKSQSVLVQLFDVLTPRYLEIVVRLFEENGLPGEKSSL